MLSLVLAMLMSDVNTAGSLQLCDNPLSTPWKECIVYPGHQFVARYQLPPLTQFGAELAMSFTITSPNGEEVLRSDMPRQDVKADLANAVYFVPVQLPFHLTAGEYLFTLKANGSDKKLELKKTLHVKPGKLAFVQTNLTYDLEGKVPVSPQRMTVLQTVQIHFSVNGVGVEKNTSNIQAECEVRSETGEVLQTIKLPESPQPALTVPGEKTVLRGGRFNVTVNLPGKYRLRIKIVDMTTWDAVMKEFAVQYHLPE
jgi:hypothetical protein